MDANARLLLGQVFDAERFIREIRKRPAIWNARSADYNDRTLKIQHWEDVVDVYGADLSIQDKKELGHTLQKKWRNIRDNFVRELKKMATRKTGMSMIRRKNRYMFFTDLLFLKDAILSNQQVDLNDVFSDLETCTKPGTVDTDTSIPFVEPIVTPDEITCDAEMENNLQQEKPPRQDPLWQEPPKQEPTRQVRVNLPAPPSILKPPPIKKWKPEEGIDGKLLEVLNKNMKKMESENDEDRLFFLSLVKDFKMVPQHLQLQTKCKIIQVIAKARQTDNHSRNSFHSSPVSFQSEESTSSRDSSEFVTPTIKSESVLEFNNHH